MQVSNPERFEFLRDAIVQHILSQNAYLYLLRNYHLKRETMPIRSYYGRWRRIPVLAQQQKE